MIDRDVQRRSFLAAMITAGAGSVLTPIASAAAARGREATSIDALGALRRIRAGVLNVGYHESGPPTGTVVILLHGFPYDVHSYAEVAPALAAKGLHVVVPHLRGHGATRFLDGSTPRSGEQAALGEDLLAFMDALKIDRAILAGYDWGGRAACVAAALQPARCSGLVSVNSYLIQDIAHASSPAPAPVERGFWYQFYFTTERGRAGLSANRRDIARIMWGDNSPTWKFNEATFARSAAAFDNPDYVDVVIHSYRHRLGLAPGFSAYAGTQQRLAALPPITVPAITLDGTSDGVVKATDGSSSAAKFSQQRVHRQIAGAGHNLPQEAPAAFTQAVLDLLHR